MNIYNTNRAHWICTGCETRVFSYEEPISDGERVWVIESVRSTDHDFKTQIPSDCDVAQVKNILDE